MTPLPQPITDLDIARVKGFINALYLAPDERITEGVIITASLIARMEQAEADNARLRLALKPFVAKGNVSYSAISHMPDELPDSADAASDVTAGDIRRARAALAQAPQIATE